MESQIETLKELQKSRDLDIQCRSCSQPICRVLHLKKAVELSDKTIYLRLMNELQISKSDHLSASYHLKVNKKKTQINASLHFQGGVTAPLICMHCTTQVGVFLLSCGGRMQDFEKCSLLSYTQIVIPPLEKLRKEKEKEERRARSFQTLKQIVQHKLSDSLPKTIKKLDQEFKQLRLEIAQRKRIN